QFLQALHKRRSATLHLGVLRTGIREYAYAPDAFLRLRRERPRRRRAAEKRDELAPSHVGHGGVLPQRSAPRVSRSGRQVLGQHLKFSESGVNSLAQQWGWRGMLSDRRIPFACG